MASVVARKKNPSPRSETPKVYSPVGLRMESGALAVKVIRQFELGGSAVISDTFMVATRYFSLLSENGTGSAEYNTERMSSGSLLGTTAVPPSSGLPPRRTSRAKSVTCDPAIPSIPAATQVAFSSAVGRPFGALGKPLPSTGDGISAPVAPRPLICRVT